MKIHPDLRHEDYMSYLMNREDLVKEISRRMLPFVSKYNIRTDTLLDEIEDEILKGRMSDT